MSLFILPPVFHKSPFRKFFLSAAVLLIFFQTGFADVKTWTGSAGDGRWSTAVNWNDNTLPLLTDNVIFDNTFISGSYSVKISGSDSLLINSLTISPADGKSITVTIDTSSTKQIALTLFAPEYSMIINNGGSFINASRVSEGAVISMTDSLEINNGGLYKHQTRRPHSAIVAKLSRKPGTERGTFEFDLPSGTGTLSLSNRVYGNLVLSATNAGGSRSYSGSGSNTLTINGDLIIHTGVNFSVDLATANGNILVKGNFIQEGGSLNLASGAGDMTILKIAGDITQSSTGQVTESSTGFPSIELNGSARQNISFAGSIVNDVAFRINNPAGVVLQLPLSLPYKLELVTGSITTTAANLLSLQSNCTIRADSTAANNFINGPLRKEGLSATAYFLFPVGKAPAMRWLELKNATGNFTVEYMKEDPRTISDNYGPGIDHISSHDYWTVDADGSVSPSANAELSFADGSNNGVTDMVSLRIAQLSAGTWADRNNIATTGTPGASGSVISETVNVFGPAAGHFALAANTPDQNPLPLTLISFSGSSRNNQVMLNWQINLPGDTACFIITVSPDNDHFHAIGKMNAKELQTNYQFAANPSYGGINYYRLQVIEQNGNSYFSKVLSITNTAIVPAIYFTSYSVVSNSLGINITSPSRSKLQLMIVSVDGEILKNMAVFTERGDNRMILDVCGLPGGVYYLLGQNPKERTNVLRFIKQ